MFIYNTFENVDEFGKLWIKVIYNDFVRNVIKLVKDFSRSSLKALEENLVISLILHLFLFEGCLLTISINN